MLLGTLLPNLIIFLLISFSNSYLFTFNFKKQLLYPSLNYSLKLLPFLFLFYFENQIDKYLIELKLGLTEVGLYALLLKLFGLLVLAMNAMDDGIRPFLYRDLKKGTANANKYFSLYIGFAMLVLVFINALGYNLELFFKNEEYLVIKEYFFLSSIVFLLFIPVRYFGLLLVFYKAAFRLSYITAIKVVVMAVLMYFLIPKYELYGALYALLISYVLNSILYAFILKRKLLIIPNAKTIITIILFICSTYFVHTQIDVPSQLFYSIVYLFVLVTCFVFMYFKEGYILLKSKSET